MIKRKIYNWFKSFFSKFIENDFDIERRLAVKELRDHYQKIVEQVGKEEKDHYNSIVDNQVETRLSQLNFSVNPTHVFQINKLGVPYLNMEPLDRPKAEQLKDEAKQLKDMLLYDILDSTLRNEAIKQGLLNSSKWEHILGAKQIVFNLDIIKGIINKISTIDISKIPERVQSSIVK